jgi:hypothetical protein
MTQSGHQRRDLAVLHKGSRQWYASGRGAIHEATGLHHDFR